MVRAILNGSKTQTRRVITPPPGHPVTATKDEGVWSCKKDRVTYRYFACPYGQPGDRLWVRETYIRGGNGKPLHCADADPEELGLAQDNGFKKTPSIFMRKWECRLRLEIEEVRVEPVASISVEDAIAEGVPTTGFASPLKEYEMLWESINAKRGFSWKINPWVWVVKFRRLPS